MAIKNTHQKSVGFMQFFTARLLLWCCIIAVSGLSRATVWLREGDTGRLVEDEFEERYTLLEVGD